MIGQISGGGKKPAKGENQEGETEDEFPAAGFTAIENGSDSCVNGDDCHIYGRILLDRESQQGKKDGQRQLFSFDRPHQPQDQHGEKFVLVEIVEAAHGGDGECRVNDRHRHLGEVGELIVTGDEDGGDDTRGQQHGLSDLQGHGRGEQGVEGQKEVAGGGDMHHEMGQKHVTLRRDEGESRFLHVVEHIDEQTEIKVGGGKGQVAHTGGDADDGGAEVKDANLVDVSVLGDEDNISLKVWAPDKAVSLVKEQIEAFKAAYPEKTFTKIEVVAQGEGDAGTQLMNDASTAADVFSFACDQLNRLSDAGVIMPVNTNLAKDVTARNSEKSISAATIDGLLLAYPETGDNGYYLVYDKRLVSDEEAKSLEGIFEACRKANKKFIVDAGSGFYGCMFPFTGGLKIEGLEGEDNDVQKFNDYDEAEVVATLEAFATLFHEYEDIFFATSPDKISAGLAEDPSTVAAGVDGSWNAATVAKILGDNYVCADGQTHEKVRQQIDQCTGGTYRRQ
mgnify:CR=1 FL=1